MFKARRGFLPFTRPLEGRRWSPEAAAHFFRILTEMAGTIVAQVIHSHSSHTAPVLKETVSIVADLDPGSVAFFTTGSGIQNRFFLEL
jgi:ABC-type arginine transport system ATPase subunit